MQPQNSHHAATEPQGSEAQQGPDFGPAIAELQRAARKKQVDVESAEADLQRCFKAYRDGYPASDTSAVAVEAAEWFKVRQNERQIVTKAKPHLKKIANNLATLQNQIDELLHHNQWHFLLWFTADAYAELPEVKAALDERNSMIVEELKNSEFEDHADYEDALAATHWAGIDILGNDLAGLRRAVDVMHHRLEAVVKKRSPSPSRKPKRLRRYVIELSEVYLKHAGRKAASGSLGGNSREGGPFVRFVRAVLREHDIDEANRDALGQTIYEWLVSERKHQSFLKALEELEG